MDRRIEETDLVRIRISVRNLVEFLLRSGDIDRRTGAFDADAMAMGRSIHRKIQSRSGALYQAEVPLKDTEFFPEDGYCLTVEGRADGIIEEKGRVTIDEIKGMYRDVREFTEPVPVYLAQAKCYAYMYLKKLRTGEEKPGEGGREGNGLEDGGRKDGREADGITVQLTYVNMDTEQVRRMKQDFTFSDLEAWYRDLLSQYRRWAVYTVTHGKARQKSIRNMTFPYPYRKGQRRLLAAVYRTIAEKKKLFIQAPTGSGKTITAIFPALKAVGEGKSSRIFYLTSRTMARTVAEECFRTLTERGLSFRTVTLTSKGKICPMLPGDSDKDDGVMPPCSPEECPRAKGHFDRVNDTVYRLLSEGGPLDRERILRAAEEGMVCPFELSLDLTDWADGIICDYNYVFDPNARLQRFFGAETKGDHIFLIDEAHNLVDRGRDMYSADLYREEFLAVDKSLKAHRDGALLRQTLKRCLQYLLDEKKKFQDEEGQSGILRAPYRKVEDIGPFPLLLSNLDVRTGEFLQEEHAPDLTEEVTGFYFRIRDFEGALDRFSDKYAMVTRIAEDGRFQIRAACLDPSKDLQECMDKGRASVLFSATFLPLKYYGSLLSARTDDYAVYASSVFDTSKRKILIGRDVSTRYQDRGPETFRKIAEYIRKVTSAKTGNYMVFFSSYRMMESTAQALADRKPDGVRIICQTSGMSEKEREEFLEHFRKGPENSREDQESLCGFCVMGGFFGEAIDLKGESLIGVIVVGTGIPQVGPERELLREYFDRRDMDGFFYSYTCPGLAKVLQAAGRVIRTEEDRGVIVLIDDRFARYSYRSMFPGEWADAEYVTVDNIAPRLEEFWKTL